MTFPLKTRLITADEYQRMAEVGILTREDKVELINGQIVEMSPIGSKHASFVKRITALFYRFLADQVTISVQDPVIADRYSEPEPDVAILHPSEDDYENHFPTAKDVFLIIEVADSSLNYDREIKLPIYAKAGIGEYWIVNVEARNIEAYHTPVGDHYKFMEVIEVNDNLLFRAFDLSIPAASILG